MSLKICASAILLLTLTACATKPPDEPGISIKLSGTSTEVQSFIEDKMREKSSSFEIDDVTDRKLVLKAECAAMAEVSTLQCAGIMMAIGNSGWSGPYLYATFRTAEIRGVVNVTLDTKWCAVNAFGKTNCGLPESNLERNKILLKLKNKYEEEVRHFGESP